LGLSFLRKSGCSTISLSPLSKYFFQLFISRMMPKRPIEKNAIPEMSTISRTSCRKSAERAQTETPAIATPASAKATPQRAVLLAKRSTVNVFMLIGCTPW
jgi:hypothetical protein